MRTSKVLQVRYKGDLVGTLATTADRRVAFAYEDSWLENGFSISPFSLPLRKQVFFPTKNYFRSGMGKRRCAHIIDEIEETVGEMLGRYLHL